MKKLFTLLFIGSMITSCSNDNNINEIEEPEAAVTLEDQVAEGLFDNSSLGIYEGVFTTLDGSYRSTVAIQLDGKNVPTVSFLFPDGTKSSIKAASNLKAQAGTINFSNDKFNFDFSVEEDGTNPEVTNVTYAGKKGDIIIFKETSKGAVSPKTGTYDCVDCEGHPELGEPGALQTFNVVLTAGAESDMEIQLTLNDHTYYGNMTQSACQSSAFGDYTTCKLNGSIAGNTGPVTINPSNTRTTFHQYRSGTGDCSTIQGVMSYTSSLFGGPFIMAFNTDDPVGPDGDCL